MQIHLFVSDSAPARNRIKAELKKTLRTNTAIHHQSPDDFHGITVGADNEPITSVIMPANNKELSRLAEIKDFWSRSKNILILPDEEPETLKLAGLIRPIFITIMDDDFSKVVLILKHIKDRFEMNIQKPVKSPR
jgi:hypothetical protein